MTTMPSETGVVQAVSSLGPNWIFSDPSGFQHRLAGGAVDHRAADFHQAHAAHPHRLHLGVVAKYRDIDADLLGGVHDQRALRHGHLSSIDRQVTTLPFLLQMAISATQVASMDLPAMSFGSCH